MARNIADIEKDLMALPTQERARLAHDLIVSLNEEEEKLSQEEWEAAWLAESEQRSNEIDSGKATLVSLKEVMAELKSRYPKE